MPQDKLYLTSGNNWWYDYAKEVTDRVFTEYLLPEEIEDWIFLSKLALQAGKKGIDLVTKGDPPTNQEEFVGDLLQLVTLQAILERWARDGIEVSEDGQLAVNSPAQYMDP